MLQASKFENNTFFKACLILALLVLPMLRVGYYGVPMFLDDAAIVFIYALNLLNHGAIFFNIPADRIDGFTSMIDVLFALPLAAINAEAMYELNYYVKAAMTSLVPLAAFLVLRKQQVTIINAGLVALAIALSTPLAHGFGMQLEAPYYALFICAFIGNLLSNGKRRLLLLSLSGIALCLTRPESPALIFSALSAYIFLFRNDALRRRQTVTAMIVIAVFLAIWYSWRIYYFGYWAPNTYYAKLSGTRLEEIQQGLSYLLYFFGSSADVWLCIGALLSLSGLAYLQFYKNDAADQVTRVAANNALVVGFAACTMLAVRIATGGDSYTISARLLIDFYLLTALTAGLLTTAITQQRLNYVLAALVAVSILGNTLVIVRNLPGNIGGFIKQQRILSATLQCERNAITALHAANPDARFAQTDFQRAKYYAPDMHMIDLSGLNSREIAHREATDSNVYGKHDLKHALDKKVELWKIGTGPIEQAPVTQEEWAQTLITGEYPDTHYSDPFFIENADALSKHYKTAAIETGCDNYINLIVTGNVRIPSQ